METMLPEPTPDPDEARRRRLRRAAIVLHVGSVFGWIWVALLLWRGTRFVGFLPTIAVPLAAGVLAGRVEVAGRGVRLTRTQRIAGVISWLTLIVLLAATVPEFAAWQRHHPRLTWAAPR